MYKPHQLLTFQAVHRTGSFAIAARELGYTSSAVSQQIAGLENATGLVLFEREAHGVRATTAAHRLVELSHKVLAGLDEFDQQVRALATGVAGRIRLGSFPTASVRLVPRTLSAFAEQVPEAEITLREGEPDELVESLLDGDLDVALVYEYGLCPQQWPPALTAHPLAREDLLLLRVPDGTRALGLRQLAGRRWITSREGTAGALALTRLCAAAGFTPEIAYRSNNYDVVRELIVATGGVAVVPALGHAPDERIKVTRLPQGSASRTVLAMHRTGNTNPLLTGFLATMRQAVPSDLDHLSPLPT